MKVEYRAEVDAAAETLWDILADVKAWPEWQGTSYVEPPSGHLHEGTIFPVDLAGLLWTVTVIDADRPGRLAWVGRRPGLKALHEWEFAEFEGKTTVTNRERISGRMLPLTYPIAKKKVPEVNQRWLAALKARAEGATV
ncbi:MAG: SRPBCC family protein [Thermoleophilia bacterium]|nr:SRPBCC family protein [Thermoleophilia bacterium]